MHEEWFEIEKEAAGRIATAKRVIAVGTTTVADVGNRDASEAADCSWSGGDRYLYLSSFSFRRVDSLLTNFHLPKSTLLMLVAAFAGRDFILEAYREAVA